MASTRPAAPSYRAQGRKRNKRLPSPTRDQDSTNTSPPAQRTQQKQKRATSQAAEPQQDNQQYNQATHPKPRPSSTEGQGQLLGERFPNGAPPESATGAHLTGCGPSINASVALRSLGGYSWYKLPRQKVVG